MVSLILFTSFVAVLIFFILSEEDSEKMRKNNNINKRSDAPFDFILSWINYSEGVNVEKR